MKKFFLKHSTTYKYSNNVSESSNKIHLYPYNENNQQIVNHKITVSGNPTISTYLDDYNNMVGYFNYLPPHKYLMILAFGASSSKKSINKKFAIYARCFII